MKTTHRPAICAAVAALLTTSSPRAYAQTSADLVTPPGNILLPNYNSVPLGPNAGLEGSAYTARAGDPSAAWLNPAGLSRAEQAEVSGSSGLFQLATVSPSSLPDTGGSLQQLPSLVGFMVTGKWTFGMAVLTPTSWSQQTDSQLVVDHGTGLERFAYSADSEYEQQVGVGSIGFVAHGWRVGGGLAIVHTSLTKNEVIGDRLTGATSLRTLLVTTRASGSTLQFRPIAGAQWDLTPHWLAGATIRFPAATLGRSGSYTVDSVAENGAASIGASFFDAGARFTDKLPFEIHGGLAYVAKRLEVEVDLHAYTPIDAYAMLASGNPIVTYSATAGSAPVIQTRAFPDRLSQSRGITNVSAGGHVVLTDSGIWRAHFGVGTDLSPVAAADQFFTKVNLHEWTAGISGTKARFQFTAGLNYRAGSADDVIVHNLQNGEPVHSGIDVRTLGFIYALAYKF